MIKLARPDIRSDIHQDIRPDIRTDIRPDVRPDIRQDIRPDIRPDISSPILMTSTLNPNDMDGHRSLEPSMLAKHNLPAPSPSKKNEAGNKITFKDLRRYKFTNL